MPYFSRLTDIITCNLSSLLARAENPRTALVEVIREMNEGVAGAERSVRTAETNVARIESEISEERPQIQTWITQAQQALQEGNEAQARQALTRKHEVEDLIAGLEQQLQAAVATRDHLRTMLNALQARQADAQRRLQELEQAPAPTETDEAPQPAAPLFTSGREGRIEAELEELKRQIQEGPPPSP